MATFKKVILHFRNASRAQARPAACHPPRTVDIMCHNPHFFLYDSARFPLCGKSWNHKKMRGGFYPFEPACAPKGNSTFVSFSDSVRTSNFSYARSLSLLNRCAAHSWLCRRYKSRCRCVGGRLLTSRCCFTSFWWVTTAARPFAARTTDISQASES
jgi:hypothetical protein